MEPSHKSPLEKAREMQQLREAALDELLADLEAARGHVAELEAAFAELSGSVAGGSAKAEIKGAEGAGRRRGASAPAKNSFDPKTSTNPELLAHIVGQHPDGIGVGDLVKAARALRPSTSRQTMYATVYRMVGEDDGRLRQHGELYFLPEKEGH
jgi:hypothetical protein